MKAPVHLNGLRAFEASARHGSFSAAADELHVTPAAVGQLVRTLEEWLGAPLFHRAVTGHSRLVPTETALRALPDIRAGLDRLSLGLESLKAGGVRATLTVTVSPAFAAKWLLPRIHHFQAKAPDMDVRLDTNLKLSDFVAQGIDIGVRYGAGSWPGLAAEKLMAEEVYPVCSPQRSKRFREPGELLNETLLYDVSVDPHAGFITWDQWLAKAGAEGAVVSRRGLHINNSAAVLQAAVEGQGIALARSIMAHDDVASGRLVRLFPKIAFPSALAYYVVYRAEHAALPKLLAFRDWLFDEAAVTAGDPQK
jgi:LysR family transcriptional regulator, glycine cleavage system transcriptional activator